MRQHVNPLSRYFQLPLALPLLEDIFEQPSNPLHLDIGSANGKFLIGLAPLFPEHNFIGLEIRRSLVISSENIRNQLGIKNLKFLFCNVNVSLEDWLSTLQNGQLSIVSIQFPDPWFKKKHYKRRVVQVSLIQTIGRYLTEGGQIFLQTDLYNIINYMDNIIQSTGLFDLNLQAKEKLINYNPFPIKTEREIYVVKQGLPVYRSLYYRNDKPIVNNSSCIG